MFEFILFLVLLFFFLNFCCSNLLVWWSIFVMMTLIFIMLSKGTKSLLSIINYFVIQESLGLFFLIVNYSFLQFFVVMMKVGVAPFHFWIFSVTNGLFDWVLMWFLTFQKLPFFPVLLQIFNFKFIFLLFMGIFLCFIQLFYLKGYKNMVVLSSTESFNWILLLIFISFLNSFYLFFYYLILMVFLIPNFSKKFTSFINWETLLVFLNIPFSVSFFIKIFSLSQVFMFTDFFLLFLLFLMFLPSLSLSFWLVNMSLKNFKSSGSNIKSFFFMVFPLMFLSVV